MFCERKEIRVLVSNLCFMIHGNFRSSSSKIFSQRPVQKTKIKHKAESTRTFGEQASVEDIPGLVLFGMMAHLQVLFRLNMQRSLLFMRRSSTSKYH